MESQINYGQQKAVMKRKQKAEAKSRLEKLSKKQTRKSGRTEKQKLD